VTTISTQATAAAYDDSIVRAFTVCSIFWAIV
jgi:hypothetical protein